VVFGPVMYLRSDDRPPQMSSGFALRVAILGGMALVMFAVIFFRLWYLQVLSGDKYLAEANNNRIREIRVTAPRGEIIDRNGTVLVENRTSLALQVNPPKLSHGRQARRGEIARLANVTGLSVQRIRREMHRQLLQLPSAPVTLQKDVDYDLIYYLQEHQADFPGVAVQRVFVRRYPNGTLGAHLFGNVGEINEEQLKDPRYKGLQPGDEIGQDGVEYEYDRYLRGRAGATKVQVDALGRPTPKGQLSVVPPKPGDSLRLSIDSDLQATGEAAISQFGLPGAFVAMDVRNGQVLGLGSVPTFDPTVYTKPITPSQYKALISPDNGAPLADRAIQGLYPTGSTFKPITSVAALSSGNLTTTEAYTDTGSITVGGITFQNAGGAVNGTITLPTALQVSSDVFFYTMGLRMNGTLALQKWAHRLGVGQPTGIDLPAETGGLVPSPSWRNRLYRKGLTDRPWSVGDNINLAVGQGDVQTNPLQMATAYATIATGKVLHPHVGMEIDDSAGRVVQEIDPPPRREVKIDPSYREAILSGLHAAAQAPGGTSYGVFGGFPVPVAGKTGTAERPGQADQSWYVVLGPYPKPRVVVAVTIEQGGFGADAAAPAAAQILSKYFGAKSKPVPSASGNVE
jgi:penicillin-binding protein 2